MTKTTLGLVTGAVLIVLLLGAYILLPEPVEPELPAEPALVETEVVEEVPYMQQTLIGASVEGRAIESYTFGTGEKDVLFVGGIHGGYEWNSILLAYQFIDWFSTKEITVPDDMTIHIIPDLNPDGTAKVVSKEGRFLKSDIIAGVDQSTGRFNANGVDLNRNFGCKWQPESSWRGNTVSAGSSAFSEPEAAALRNYVTLHNPLSVTFWHSQANNVYASECENGVLPETLAIMQLYSDASGYGAVPVFDAYPVTGDAEGWLASIGIPAITVELSSHETLDLAQNRAAVEAMLEYYSPVENLGL